MSADLLGDIELQNEIINVFSEQFKTEPTQEQLEIRLTYMREFARALKTRGIELTNAQLISSIRENVSILQKAKNEFVEQTIAKNNRQPTDEELEKFIQMAMEEEDIAIIQKTHDIDNLVARVPLSRAKFQMNKYTLYFIIISMTILLIIIIIFLIADENFHPNNTRAY